MIVPRNMKSCFDHDQRRHIIMILRQCLDDMALAVDYDTVNGSYTRICIAFVLVCILYCMYINVCVYFYVGLQIYRYIYREHTVTNKNL